MKHFLLLLFLIPFINFSQVQIGQDLFFESGFGISMSSNGSGNILAVSSFLSGGDDSFVRVFELQNNTWVQLGGTLNGPVEKDYFGEEIVLSDDGTTLAIANKPSNIAETDEQYLNIYKYQGGDWVQIGNRIDQDFYLDIDFGNPSVSLSEDGNTVAVGYTFFGTSNSEYNGYVKVYENQSGNWIQKGSILYGEQDVGYAAKYGNIVKLNSTGDVLAVSASDSNWIVENDYVTVYNFENGDWNPSGFISSPLGGNANFGFRMDISALGNIIAVSSNRSSNVRGEVFIYENQGGTWAQIGNSILGEGALNSSGTSLGLNDAGNIIAIGAPGNNGVGLNNCGHIRIYKNISNIWTQIGPDIDGDNSEQQIGYALTLNNTGNILSVGSSYSVPNPKYVRTYDLSALLSVEEQNFSDFKIYPNPTQDQFTIQLENPLDLQEVKIYSQLGQLVLTSKETIINTSQLNAGLYMVEVTTAKRKGTKKLIIE